MTGKKQQPLSGGVTHPLKPASLAALRDLLARPAPRQSLNPGVADRLLRDALVEVASMPSPYKVHKGKDIDFLVVTEAGRTVARGA